MGQIMSRTPGKDENRWKHLMNERDRILRCSSEILARVQDNVTDEDTFLMDYDDEKIVSKMDTWITTTEPEFEDILNLCSNGTYEYKKNTEYIRVRMQKLTAELLANMRKDYQHAYNDIRKLNKRVDLLGKRERKLHFKILKLEEECVCDMQKFQKKLRSLSTKVLDNCIISEKMMFQEKKLKIDFAKKVYNINRKNFANYAKRIKKLMREFENNTTQTT